MERVRAIVYMQYARLLAQHFGALPDNAFDPASWLEGLDDAAWKG